jgi:PTH1 family peptidyl-tRNA hydrolase
VKPLTFMNESGRAVTSLRTRGVIRELSELLVVSDDVDLELGSVRFRERGSAGGHNGLASIIDALGTGEFARLRIGVGPRPAGAEMVEYVLAEFGPGERDLLEPALVSGARAVAAWVDGGVEEARRELERHRLRQE